MRVPIAAGLSAGERRPVLPIQNTGMLKSGGSIRGWPMGLNVPAVPMEGYRGHTRHGADTDTESIYTERFPMAFDIAFQPIENDDYS